MFTTSAKQASLGGAPELDTTTARPASSSTIPSSFHAGDSLHELAMPTAFGPSCSAEKSGPSAERLKEWLVWEQSTHGIVDGLGRGLDTGIVPVVTGLNALKITTSMSCEGHLTPRSQPSPMVEIGASSGVFDIRFEGQGKLFRDMLQEVSVPLIVRLSNPLTVGFSALAPEMISAIDTPQLRRSYPQFWEKIARAYTESLNQAAYPKSGRPAPFTPDEEVRRATNRELLRRVTALVEEFNSNRADNPLHKALIRSWEGVHFDLVFGDHREGAPRDAACLERRQAVAADFGRFLREKFLSGT